MIRKAAAIIVMHLWVAHVLVFGVVGQQQQGSYKAAVVEFAPRLTAARAGDRVLENVREYGIFIEQAAEKGVDMIVFPEDGLTGWEGLSRQNVDEQSTEVPEPSENISPCFNAHLNYSKFFVDLSCAAQTHGIYAVVNLIEKQTNGTGNGSAIYHNTNVVFDRSGRVAARFRKINLFNEALYEPGTNLSTFTTDFGVTFGMFVCFDMLFKNPAIDVLRNSTTPTDVLYSAAWFSQLPFYQALSIQDGYAKSNGLNLLAAGLDDPSKGNGGSGIYLAEGRAAETYVSGMRGSKMIIQDVPMVTARRDVDTCVNFTESKDAARRIGGGEMSISNFVTTIENTANYTFKAVNVSQRVISETVCSGKHFCCSFNITVGASTAPPNYAYKLIAYYGVTQVTRIQSLGLRNCGLVACLNESATTCGGRHEARPTVTFDSVSLRGIFAANATHVQPATVRHDMRPVANYTYCRRKLNADEVEIVMATAQAQGELLTFGLHARAYDHDNQPAGLISSAMLRVTNVYAMFVVSIFVFLLQD